MEEIIDKIFKKKYPKGLSYEFTREEMIGYMCAINDIKEQLRIGGVGSSKRVNYDDVANIISIVIKNTKLNDNQTSMTKVEDVAEDIEKKYLVLKR